MLRGTIVGSCEAKKNPHRLVHGATKAKSCWVHGGEGTWVKRNLDPESYDKHLVALRKEIQAGRYRVSPEVLADKMLDLALWNCACLRESKPVSSSSEDGDPQPRKKSHSVKNRRATLRLSP